MDYSYGLASTIFPYILGKLNITALSLHDYVDAARFNPEQSASINVGDELSKIILSLGYEIGFMLEPGAEKISIIDERGIWYPTTRLLSIITKLFLETNRNREPYKIAVSIAASNEVDIIAKDYNVEVIRIKDSHSAMMEATRDEKVVFVGGIWGGFIFSDFLFASDGMFTVGKILEMLAETKKKIFEIDDELPRRYQSQELVDCPWENKGMVMRQAMEYSENFERQLVEGVKIFLNGNSILMMPDKESPVFHVIAESDKAETAKDLANEYKELLMQWQKEI